MAVASLRRSVRRHHATDQWGHDSRAHELLGMTRSGCVLFVRPERAVPEGRKRRLPLQLGPRAVVRLDRHPRKDSVAAGQNRAGLERASVQRDSLLHSDQAVAAALGAGEKWRSGTASVV